MSTVAEKLRKRDREHVEGLSVDDRLALAFSLGENDLEIFRASSGLSRSEAIEHLRRQRQRGRNPCRCVQFRKES